jgi:hypothetical protein
MHDATTGRTLDSENADDRDRMAKFMEESVAAGATGIGHSLHYMGTKRTHIGGGEPKVAWGDGASSAGAPDWVTKAFQNGCAHSLTAAQLAVKLSELRSAGQGSTPSTGGDNVKVLASVRRQRFAAEVAKPEIHRLIAASTDAEVGDQGPKAAQYYIESVFNRAAARGKSLEMTIRDVHYYPATTTNKLDETISPGKQAQIDKIIDSVMAGANESNFATGNESGSVGLGPPPQPQITRNMGLHKERFVRELPDLRWIRTMEAAAARGDEVA